MTRYRKQVGETGERLAAQFLQQKGYTILEQNYYVRGGEIDIVAQNDDTLVFVEVKCARSHAFGPPETWVDERKQQRLGLASDIYLQRNDIEDMDCRFDVIAVDLSHNPPTIRHLENAFWLEE